jgi:hypothetical protein
MNSYFRQSYTALLLIALGTIGTPYAFAYIASSTNYRIMEDSVNVGGVLSTSTSYRAEDTLGEEGVGVSTSTNYAIKAGYQQMQEVYLAVSAPGSVSLLPNIPALGGGIANGFTSYTVTTDNVAGYAMSLRASGAPALVSGVNNFSDYIPLGANPDFSFTTPSAANRFGFTPEGADIVQKYKDNGVSCNAGISDTGSACWGPLAVVAENIVSRTTQNSPSGTQTTIRFRAESGSANTQAAGFYTATATVTIIPN